MSRRKLKWMIIFILCAAVLISGFIYYRYVTRPRTIEEQCFLVKPPCILQPSVL